MQAIGGIVGGMLFLLVLAFVLGIMMRRQKTKNYRKKIEEATAKLTRPNTQAGSYNETTSYPF